MRSVACAVSWATWLLFTALPARCAALPVRCPGPLGSCAPVSSLDALCSVCSVLNHLAPVHLCACLVRCGPCVVSLATWLLFTVLLACCVVLRVQCPGPLGSCSPVCPLRALRSLCAVSWATWLLFPGLLPWRFVLRVRCPGPLASCSPVCPLGVLCCVCGVLGHLAPVNQCARLMCCIVMRCPRPLGSCSPVCSLGVLCCVCGVLGHVALVHRCARLVGCVACVRYPGPPGSCSPVCPLAVLCRMCCVLGHLFPVHRCARSVPCVACAVSRATWLHFTGAHAWCVVLLGESWVTWLLFISLLAGRVVLFCRIQGHLASVHWCAASARCVVCAESWATYLFFTGPPARCAVRRVRCPGPLGSISPARTLGALCCWENPGSLGSCSSVCSLGVLYCFAVSRATWLLFTGVLPQRVALCVRSPGPLTSSSPVRPLGALCGVCGVLGHSAPVHRCAHLVCCVAVRWPGRFSSYIPGVLALCVVLRALCPGPLAPVLRCARSACSVACSVSSASWLLFTGVLARCVVLCAVCAVSWACWLLFTGLRAGCVVLRFSYRASLNSAPGPFRVDADSSLFRSEDATPGSSLCVPVGASLGCGGRADLPGAFWCASPFLWLFGPSALLGPLRTGVTPFLPVCLRPLPPSFFFSEPPLSPALSGFRPRVPLALTLPAPPPPPASGPRCFFFSFLSRGLSPGLLGLVFVSFRPACFGVCFLGVYFLPACRSSFSFLSIFSFFSPAFCAPPP